MPLNEPHNKTLHTLQKDQTVSPFIEGGVLDATYPPFDCFGQDSIDAHQSLF